MHICSYALFFIAMYSIQLCLCVYYMCTLKFMCVCVCKVLWGQAGVVRMWLSLCQGKHFKCRSA